MRFLYKNPKGGRMTKKLKNLMGDVREEFQKLGEDGVYEFGSEEELEAIRQRVLESRQTNVNSSFSSLSSVDKEKIKMPEVEEKNNNTMDAPQSVEPNIGNANQFDFTGITEPIKQREYNEMPVTEYMGVDVPEPQITNSIEALLKEKREKDIAENSQSESEAAEQKQESQSFENPEMKELSDKEKKYAAEQLVKTALSAYEGLHQIGRHYAKFNETKINTLIQDGEIDGDVTFPVDAQGNEANITEYATAFNENVDEILTVSPEFVEDVSPVLTRIFIKKNWGVTDEQYVLGAVLKDAGVKAAQVIQLNQSAKMILNSLKEHKKRVDSESGKAVSPSSISRNAPSSNDFTEVEQD